MVRGFSYSYQIPVTYPDTYTVHVHENRQESRIISDCPPCTPFEHQRLFIKAKFNLHRSEMVWRVPTAGTYRVDAHFEIIIMLLQILRYHLVGHLRYANFILWDARPHIWDWNTKINALDALSFSFKRCVVHFNWTGIICILFVCEA